MFKKCQLILYGLHFRYEFGLLPFCIKSNHKLILMSKIFGCAPSFEKVPDFLSGGKPPKLMTDGTDRGTTAPSNDIYILSYPFILSLGKIFVIFIFLLNQVSHFSSNDTPYFASLKITSHCISLVNVGWAIKCDQNGT